MGERLGLPVIHLETLYWLPGWQAPPPGAHRGAFAAAFAQEAWISEGNFIETFDLRLHRADLVVILEQPRRLCLWRALRRAVLSRRDRPDLAPGCPEQFDRQLLRDIWRFGADTRPRLETALREHGGDTRVIRLRGDRAVAAFLAGLSGSPPSPCP
jgi:adenylate kinase family enzyme